MQNIYKVLVLPSVSTSKDIWCESDFVVYYQIASQLPDIMFYMPVGGKADIPTEFRLPNLTLVEMSEWFPFVPSQGMISSELFRLFNPVNGCYQVDVIITSKSAVAASLKRMFFISDSVSVPVCILEPKASAPGCTHDTVTELDLKLRALSYSECPTFFATDRERGIGLSLLKHYMTPSMCTKSLKNFIVRSQGFQAKYLSDIRKGSIKFSDFTMIFSARFNPNKRWKEVLSKMVGIKVRLHGNAHIKAITPNDVDSKLLKNFSDVEFIKPLLYTEYIELLSKCHLSICMSKEEGFAVGWVEKVCLGVPVLFPKTEWALNLVGKDYDFYYTSDSEIFTLARWVHDNPKEAQTKLDKTVNWLCDKHDISHASSEILHEFQKNLVSTYMSYSEWLEKWKKILDEMPDIFSFKLFIDTASKKYKATFGNFLMLISSYRNIYRWLCENTEVVHSKEMAFKKV